MVESSSRSNTRRECCNECREMSGDFYRLRSDLYLCAGCWEQQVRRDTRAYLYGAMPVDKTVSVKFRKFQIKGMAKGGDHRA